jgi:peptidoglycan/LPS O-acetylase OafA/YrhL
MLRAAAALLVVLFHTQFIFGARTGQIPFANAFGAGFRGVDLFFVLSGFIIATVHGEDVGRPTRLPNYVFNRIARIYPAVWIMTALAIGLYATGFGGPDKAAKLEPAAVLASILVLPQRGEALVNVTWTLTYELFFYAVFALAIANRRMGLTVLLVWQVATAVVTLSGANLGLPGYYLSSICLEFSVGLACALFLRRPARPIHAAIWFGLLVVGVLGFAFGMKEDQAVPWAGIPCALASGVMILSLVRLEQAGWWYTPSLLVRIGGASYAIYLVHFSVITLGAGLLGHLGVPGTDVMCLAVAATGVLAGLAFDHLVDQPIQRWLRRRKRTILGPSPAW